MKRLTITCLALAAVNLSGCAQIMNIGDAVWGETKQITTGSKNKLLSLLRPRAERQDPVFEAQPANTEQYAAYDAPSYVSGLTPIDLEMYEFVSELPPLPIRKYVSHSVIEIYSLPSQDPYQLAGAPEPRYIVSQPEPELPDLSYVKVAGQTSAIDWQNCQNLAGGYITADDNGFKVRPDFDQCMRVNGYIPEREALQFMASQTLP